MSYQAEDLFIVVNISLWLRLITTNFGLIILHIMLNLIQYLLIIKSCPIMELVLFGYC